MSPPILLRLALPADESLPALRAHVEATGIDLSGLAEDIVVQVPGAWEGVNLEVMILPTNDIGTYVERGVVQMGVLSTHLINERQVGVWRPFTFDVGQYPIVLAGGRGQTLASLTARPSLRLATPIPGFTREWFSARGFDVEVVPVERSARTAVTLGLAEGFVDRLIAPEDLTNHDFLALERLGTSSLKLVVNSALSAKTRSAIRHFIEALENNRPDPSKPIFVPFELEY